MLATLAGTLPYILADEWLTRGPHAARFAYPATKLLFLLSLGLANALAFAWARAVTFPLLGG